ncbi:MAG: DUF1289 domain-containing protein [Methylotenera sp.]|nr:DUF1289 domain-containing protein [Methylotenera sp.]MSP99693.1 DUF1289 domain-containing protein [Methylotenera sp.]
MSENTQNEIQSPCISVCTMDDSTGLCLGCYRTVDEIKVWREMSQQQQVNLLVALEERQLQQARLDD